MTDPIIQAQNELNEAVANLADARSFADEYPSADNIHVVVMQSERVEELRFRYNALIVAYDNSQ